MKILIVGLGLIGGSYAKGLSMKGHQVYGVDKDKSSVDFAKNNGYITKGSDEPLEYITEVDLIIIGLYPKAILSFLEKYQDSFIKDQVITDVCGIKLSFVNEAKKLAGKAEYLSHHPMAGREKVGIINATETIFKGANFLICPFDESTKHAINVLEEIALDLNFGNIKLITPARHDEMISFTSQLTHAIAVSLVNTDKDKDTKDYIGDSYRDLTRIAMINENLWAELFLENKTILLKKINDFEEQLDILKKCLFDDNEEGLKELFINSKNKRKEM